jgi:hypothetical protein
VRNETSVKSGCFFFLLPFSFFLPDEQVFFSLARKRRKKEAGRRKNAQLNYAQSSSNYCGQAVGLIISHFPFVIFYLSLVTCAYSSNDN